MDRRGGEGGHSVQSHLYRRIQPGRSSGPLLVTHDGPQARRCGGTVLLAPSPRLVPIRKDISSLSQHLGLFINPFCLENRGQHGDANDAVPRGRGPGGASQVGTGKRGYIEEIQQDRRLQNLQEPGPLVFRQGPAAVHHMSRLKTLPISF